MPAKKEISFEQALSELQAVTERLQEGRVPLEQSLSLYERGMELVRICNARLDSAEKRVNAVTVGADGVTTVAFDTGAES